MWADGVYSVDLELNNGEAMWTIVQPAFVELALAPRSRLQAATHTLAYRLGGATAQAAKPLASPAKLRAPRPSGAAP